MPLDEALILEGLEPSGDGRPTESSGLGDVARAQTASSGSYTHDPDGNLTGATGGGAGTLDGLQLGYNLPGQTTSTDPPGTTGPLAMAYDGVMQDRRTQAGDTTMSYGYAGLTAQSTSGTGGHSELFVRDPAGGLLAMITDAAAGEARYYLTDDQKSVIGTVDASGAEVIRYLYEPYGERIRSWVDPNAGTSTNDGAENGNLTAPSGDHNPWGYASGYHDPGTGFIKFGTRYYMPQLATWTQADPQNGKAENPLSLNPHGYVGGNPINETDSNGRDWFSDAWEEANDVLSVAEVTITGVTLGVLTVSAGWALGGAVAKWAGAIAGTALIVSALFVGYLMVDEYWL